MNQETAIAHAARLLREAATEYAQGVSINGVPDWANERETHAAYLEHMAAAAALESMPNQCLLQIQEPTPAEQAAWHAGLDEGRAQATVNQQLTVGQTAQPGWWRKRADEIEQKVAMSGSKEAMCCFTDMRTLLQAATEPNAAPAAVAVPDERAAFEKWASFVGYGIKRWQADANLYEDNGTEDAWIVWQARAALSATPADARDAVEKLPRYTYGYKRSIWRCNRCGALVYSEHLNADAAEVAAIDAAIAKLKANAQRSQAQEGQQQ